MKSIIYSREAHRSLDKIYDHICKNFSEELAQETIRTMLKNIEAIKSFPYIGKLSELSPILRELVVGDNVILYQTTDETVDIVHIKPRRTSK